MLPANLNTPLILGSQAYLEVKHAEMEMADDINVLLHINSFVSNGEGKCTLETTCIQYISNGSCLG